MEDKGRAYVELLYAYALVQNQINAQYEEMLKRVIADLKRVNATEDAIDESINVASVKQK